MCSQTTLLYDLARGDLDCLRGSCNPVSMTCVEQVSPTECGDVDTQGVDTMAPPVGHGYWYLVRVNAETWNSDGAGQCTDYNPATGILACSP